MPPIVAKFGGTSLADAAQFRKVQAIIQADPDRRYVVVSAPGKRSADDTKVTDLLYACHERAAAGKPIDSAFAAIIERYEQIISELGLSLDLTETFARVRATLLRESSPDYAASRGEFLNAHIMAALLGVAMVDTAEVIVFDPQGRLDREETNRRLADVLNPLDCAVLPGFYGSQTDGRVRTFSRGGSDITGALVARAVQARVYENWTDVPGLLMADPRVVPDPKPMERLTYRELRELSYSGASVLHDEAIFPVREAGIPVHIRSTNQPDAAGSMIVPHVKEEPLRDAEEALATKQTGGITGIAGRVGFTVVAIDQALMNTRIGFGRMVLQAFEDHGVSFEHMPSGIDTLSVVVDDRQIQGEKLEAVLQALHATANPDHVEVYPGLALIAVVGRRMAHIPGMAGRVFGALAEAKINIRMIDQGSSELNIIVGVEAADYPDAVRAIYDAFVTDQCAQDDA